MKIYLAGSSQEADTIEAFASRLASAGWEITYPWWNLIKEERAKGVTTDADLSIDYMVKVAREERDAVLASDVLWLLAPEKPSRGCWVELGIALGKQKTLDHLFPEEVGREIVVISGKSTQTLFGCLGGFLGETHEDAFEFLTTRDWKKVFG